MILGVKDDSVIFSDDYEDNVSLLSSPVPANKIPLGIVYSSLSRASSASSLLCYSSSSTAIRHHPSVILYPNSSGSMCKLVNTYTQTLVTTILEQK